jgi:glycyl-tRNA synthetase alpha subunit
MDGLNIQTFVQWIITGGISLTAIILGLKYGLQDLKNNFETLDRNIKEEFASLKKELDEMKEAQHDDNKTLAVQQFRLDKLEKDMENFKQKK